MLSKFCNHELLIMYTHVLNFGVSFYLKKDESVPQYLDLDFFFPTEQSLVSTVPRLHLKINGRHDYK
jgi:hypothetical protein